MLCESELYCAKHERRIVWYCPECHEEWRSRQ